MNLHQSGDFRLSCQYSFVRNWEYYQQSILTYELSMKNIGHLFLPDLTHDKSYAQYTVILLLISATGKTTAAYSPPYN